MHPVFLFVFRAAPYRKWMPPSHLQRMLLTGIAVILAATE